MAYILKSDYHLDLPRRLQIEFMRVIQGITDATGKEITPEEIWAAFEATDLTPVPMLQLVEYDTSDHASIGSPQRTMLHAVLRTNGIQRTIIGSGNGPIAALTDALARECGIQIQVVDSLSIPLIRVQMPVQSPISRLVAATTQQYGESGCTRIS